MPVTADDTPTSSSAPPSPDGHARVQRARHRVRSVVAQRPQPHRRVGDLAAPATAQARTLQAHRRRGAKDAVADVGGDGTALFYVSDRSGAREHLARPHRRRGRAGDAFATGACCGRRSPLTAGPSRSSATSASGRSTRRAAQAKRGADRAARRAGGAGVEHLRLTNRFTELALSPDGRKVAFVARGEVFAASAKDGGDADVSRRLAGARVRCRWTPDSRRCVYVSERDGAAAASTRTTSRRGARRALPTGARRTQRAVVSPDGSRSRSSAAAASCA